MTSLSSLTLLDYERAVARLVVATVIEATPQLGRPPSRGFLAAVLVGSMRRDLVCADAHRITTFGVLASHGLDRVYEWIDRLMQEGVIETIHGCRGIVCTAKGRALLDVLTNFAEDARPLGLLRGAVDHAKLDRAVRAGLVEALRRYRSEQAASQDVLEVRLFSEHVIREIATALPASTADLERIQGLGPKRVSEFGEELLRIVAEHLPIIERIRDYVREGA